MKRFAALIALAALLDAWSADARDPLRLIPPTATAATPATDRLGPPAARPEHVAAPIRIGAQVPIAENLNLGIGLFSVGGHFVRERGSREPLIGTAGRQNKIAAVGFNLRF